MADVDVPENFCNFYVGSQAPGVYAWMFPKGDKKANIGLGVLASKLCGKRPIDYLNEFVSKNFPEGQSVELVMGAFPSSDELKSSIGHGLLLVGDAAHHNMLGGGIMNALEGGKIAGDVARKAVRQDDSSLNVLKEYETRLHGSYGKNLKHAYKTKEFLADLSDDEWNKFIRVFKDIKPQASAIEIASILWRLLTENPKLLFLTPHLSFMREFVNYSFFYSSGELPQQHSRSVQR
jgi:digeranylgeranylglycerophospholipid reductase